VVSELLCSHGYKPGVALTTDYRTTFSGAFQTGALYKMNKSSVIFNVFMNIVLYAIFTVICYYIAWPPIWLSRVVNTHVADSKFGRGLPNIIRRAITVKRMEEELVVAVCFCGAAKTTSLGIPLAAAMWSPYSDLTVSLIQVPVLLYTIEQVFVAQFLVLVFKWWLKKAKGVDGDEESTVAEVQEQTGTSVEPAVDDEHCRGPNGDQRHVDVQGKGLS
jgi:solute carrier family 10 (sodium/bile acid cotransporter), member 7